MTHEKPPPTAIVSPVIQPDSADARNTATDAMSSGCPRRPSGVRATIAPHFWIARRNGASFSNAKCVRDSL